MRFERFILDYLIHLAANGRARETVRGRRSPLSMLARFLAQHGAESLSELSRTDLEKYLSLLRAGALSPRGKPLSDGSYQVHLAALDDFFRWLVRRGVLLSNPAEEINSAKAPRPLRLPSPLTEEEMEKVLDSCRPTTARGLRDRAVLELLYSTGIRKGELVNLSLADLRLERSELFIRNGKGGKDRVVPVGEHASAFIQAYVRLVRPWQAGDPAETAIFLEQRSGRRMSARVVRTIVEKAAARSGVEKRISPHTFRHAMATHMLRRRADLRHIQAILGHESLESTQAYTHVSIEDLKAVVRRSHPHGRRKGAAIAADGGGFERGRKGENRRPASFPSRERPS